MINEHGLTVKSALMCHVLYVSAIPNLSKNEGRKKHHIGVLPSQGVAQELDARSSPYCYHFNIYEIKWARMIV